jgi:hypothetical protein
MRHHRHAVRPHGAAARTGVIVLLTVKKISSLIKDQVDPMRQRTGIGCYKTCVPSGEPHLLKEVVACGIFSLDSEHQTRLRRLSHFSPPTTAAMSRGWNCSRMAASRRCKCLLDNRSIEASGSCRILSFGSRCQKRFVRRYFLPTSIISKSGVMAAFPGAWHSISNTVELDRAEAWRGRRGPERPRRYSTIPIPPADRSLR